jgi:hypothetical protein
MATPEGMQLRNVIATTVGKTNLGWVREPAAYGTPDRICGVCKKYRLNDYHLMWCAKADPLRRIGNSLCGDRRSARTRGGRQQCRAHYLERSLARVESATARD